MPVHVAAEVHARDDFLPDVAALRVRDRVELVEVRFLRNRRCRRCRCPTRAAPPRRARSPTLPSPAGVAPAARPRAPRRDQRSRMARTARILRRRCPASAPRRHRGAVDRRRRRARSAAARRARRRRRPLIAATMRRALDAEDADVANRVRVVAIARDARIHVLLHHREKPGHARADVSTRYEPGDGEDRACRRRSVPSPRAPRRTGRVPAAAPSTSFVTRPGERFAAFSPKKRMRPRWLRSTTIAPMRSASYSRVDVGVREHDVLASDFRRVRAAVERARRDAGFVIARAPARRRRTASSERSVWPTSVATIRVGLDRACARERADRDAPNARGARGTNACARRPRAQSPTAS